MYRTVLFIQFLLLHSAAQTEIQADCNEDISLQCPGVTSSNFLSMIWYKLINQTKVGIVRKSGEKPPDNYNFLRSARFGKDHSLFLPSLTPADSGTYECVIVADVGAQNLAHSITLTVPECVAVQTTAMDTLTTKSNKEKNMTYTDPLCHINIEKFPVMWSIIGYCGVGLAKIVFSLLSIGVVRAVLVRSSRRDKQRWKR